MTLILKADILTLVSSGAAGDRFFILRMGDLVLMITQNQLLAETAFAAELSKL